MRILIVIGAGASYDCWPAHISKPHDYKNYRLPLAKELFAPYHHQGRLLKEYKLLDIASIMRAKENALKEQFDIEAELLSISERANRLNDSNVLHSLFKTRFYLQRLITLLTSNTLDQTVGHTVYIDLIRKLKHWTEEDLENRTVDIVTFNYDTLIESAMENFYSVDWKSKNDTDQMTAYYQGQNIRIYKPHGSINWGRKIDVNNSRFSYSSVSRVFSAFQELTIQPFFSYISPDNFNASEITKTVIPAIAIPFKEKTTFDECPADMQRNMIDAITNADYLVTLGWKGAEKHFTEIISSNNKKIKSVHIINPSGTTQLNDIFPEEKIKLIASTFSEFITNDDLFEKMLEKFSE